LPGIYVIILAAGRGSRFGDAIPKQFHRDGGEVILKRSVDLFLRIECIAGITCVIPREFLALFNDIFRYESDPRLLEPTFGGDSRFDSAKNGLGFIDRFAPTHILIHDAVRCHCPKYVVEDLLAALMDGKDAVIPVVKPTDSIRLKNRPLSKPSESDLMEGDPERRTGVYFGVHQGDEYKYSSTVSTQQKTDYGEFGKKSNTSIDRADVYLVQTPQAFKFDLIHDLYKKHHDSTGEISDDASLCDISGVPVFTVAGSHLNRKITFREDVEDSSNIITTGFGYDAHKFSKSKPLYLMGISIDDHIGLDGHSDADVGIHSIVDAILGALCLGSIGEYFPSEHHEWKDANSKIFLRRCNELLCKSSARINNIDSTIVGETPRIAPYAPVMKQAIADCLGISAASVNIKGKTTDGMGFTGRNEGIAVYSIVTITRGTGG
jgi:2-C-methyl-D-erythritol 4-phosphate cytidylyltransferase/2-C-methyl-D-erythritol 2,4-cyclodiphosphate synthase